MESLNIVFPVPGCVEVVRECVPEPGRGQVLCKTEASLISIGTETTCLQGEFDEGTNWVDWVRYPFHAGYSVAARVVSLGEGVSALKVGDRVSSGVEHRQYFVADAADLDLVPESVSLTDASWVSLMRVAQNNVRKCQIQMGDSVAILGQGQVGQLITQFVRIAGASRIIAIDPASQRAELSSKSGATHVLSMDAAQALDAVRELTGGRMADVVIDSTGHPSVLAQACAMTREYGKIGMVGDCAMPSRQALGPGVISKSLSILGSHGGMVAPADNVFYPWTRHRSNQVSLEYMAQGRLRPAHLVSHVVSPLDAPDIYQAIMRDRSGYLGVLFDWTQV